MFSTIDIGATRKIVVTTKDGSVLLELPESMSQQGLSLLDRPSDMAATRFVSELTELTWTVADGVATEGGAETFDGLRLQVVGLGSVGRTLHRTVLVDVVVGASP